MKKLFLRLLCFMVLTSTGCMSYNYLYSPPKPMKKIENTIVVNESKDKVWNKLIRGIGSNFFVINNMDKQSGFINASYSGDPEKYVEGGELHYQFSNMRGERKYDFPATRAVAQFETMINGTLCTLTRKMDLEGRMNIILSEVDSTHTSVSVNARYILTMSVTGTDVLGHILQPSQQTITFNTGQSGNSAGGGEYYSNGKFEFAIMDLARW